MPEEAYFVNNLLKISLFSIFLKSKPQLETEKQRNKCHVQFETKIPPFSCQNFCEFLKKLVFEL